MDNKNRIQLWIDNNLEGLSKMGNNEGIDIMHNCGANCCMVSDIFPIVESFSEEMKDEDNLDVIFNEFKSRYYNSPRLSKDGNTITLIFEECTCPLVNEQGASNPFLCNCTVGYSYKIFETLFKRKVTVKLESAILKGDDVCVQKIELDNFGRE